MVQIPTLPVIKFVQKVSIDIQEKLGPDYA